MHFFTTVCVYLLCISNFILAYTPAQLALDAIQANQVKSKVKNIKKSATNILWCAGA